MSATTDRNLQKLPATPVDWVALYNDLCDKLELGFTIQRTAGEALVKGDPFYIKSDGKAWKADNTTACHGIWQSTSTAAEAEGFGTCYGTMTSSWSWTIGSFIYVSATKTLTQTPPSSGAKAIGYALSTTKIFIFFPRDFGLPLTTANGGTGLSAIGNANDVLGVNSDATGLEYKAVNGTTGEIEVAHAANSITIGIPETLIQQATVSLSNADIKALRATPKTLIAAPGSSKVIEFISATLRLIAGTEVLTESDDNLALRYTDGSGAIVSNTIEATGFIDQSANTLTSATRKTDAIVAETGAANQALVLHNTGDGEIAGNASNDATMEVEILYRILSF